MSAISTRSSIALLGDDGIDEFGPGARGTGEAGFTMVGQALSFGPVEIDDLTISGAEFGREHGASIRFPSTDSVRVFFVVSGKIEVTVRDDRFGFIPDTAAFIPNGCTPTLSCRTGCRLLRVRMDPAYLQRHGSTVLERFTPVSIRAVSREPALDFFLYLSRTGHDYPLRAYPTSAVIARLIGQLIRADSAPAAPDIPSVAEQARTLISHHHRNPHLSPRLLAHVLGGPRATAEQLLQERTYHERVLKAIAKERLVSMLSLLPITPDVRLDDLARRCGFSSKNALDALTREVYGLSLAQLIESQQPATTR